MSSNTDGAIADIHQHVRPLELPEFAGDPRDALVVNEHLLNVHMVVDTL